MSRRHARTAIVTAAILLFATPAHVRAETSPPDWGALARLVGTWVADTGSGGQPGAATRGGETWQRDLEGRVLVRRDFSEYPAAAGRPAFRHEGLTVISPAPGGGFVARAFDNEGHVIDYDVAAGDTAVVFTSRPAASAPQFRLTYRPVDAGYSVTFEVAPPDRPGAFRPYVTGRMHRGS